MTSVLNSAAVLAARLAIVFCALGELVGMVTAPPGDVSTCAAVVPPPPDELISDVTP